MGLLVVSAGLAALAWQLAEPRLVDLRRFQQPADSLTVTDRDGAPLRHTRPDGLDRRWVPLDDVSPNFIAAMMAAEDRRFYHHHGVDWTATARAIAYACWPWAPRTGASTITQQTVKLVYGRPWGRFSKPMEILRALALENRMSKDEILENYVNRIPFGDQIVGIARASEAYFGKPPSELSVAGKRPASRNSPSAFDHRTATPPFARPSAPIAGTSAHVGGWCHSRGAARSGGS